MKQCSKCGSMLPMSEYQLRSAAKGTYRSVCRQCRRIYDAAYYQQNAEKYKEYRRRNQPRYRNERRRRLFEYLQGKSCVDCGESDTLVLELDHVHGDKEFNIGDMASMYAWDRIAQELEKCEVRCANCHRRKTARDFKWWKGNFGT